MRKLSNISVLLLLLLLPLALTSCGGDEKGELGISLQIASLPGVDSFSNVSIIRLSVESEGTTIVDAKQSSFDPAGGSMSLDGIPYGDARQVVVEGWSSTPEGDLGFLISRGRSAPVNVSEGGDSVDLNVFMAPVNSFHPMTSLLDGNLQTLAQGRVGHTVTKTVRGEVLVVGGGTTAGPDSSWWAPEGFVAFHNSVEVLDEAQQHISLHPKGMYFGRAWHTATSLPTGQVFLSGGYTSINGQNQPLKRVEVYNPGLSSAIDVIKFDMQVPRWGHTATLLEEESFTVLFVGGDDEGSAQGTYELWNPYVGNIAFGQLPDGMMRRHHQATLFNVPDYGPAVIISGGESSTGTLDTMLIYDIQKNNMLAHPGKMVAPRTQHASVWVEGRNFVYMTGGFTTKDRSAVSNAIDVYSIVDNTVLTQPGFNLKTARGGHSVAKTFGNAVVFMGGTGQGGTPLDSLEIIYEYMDPNQGAFRIEVAQSSNQGAVIIPFLPSARTGSRSVFTDSGMVLTVGGYGEGGNQPTDVLLYSPF
jgi:hypothetical protein